MPAVPFFPGNGFLLRQGNNGGGGAQPGMGHGQEPARNAQLPGGHSRSPVQKNGRNSRIAAHHLHIRKSALRPDSRSQGFRHGLLGRKARRQMRHGIRVLPAISPLIRGADAQRKRLPVFRRAWRTRSISAKSIPNPAMRLILRQPGSIETAQSAQAVDRLAHFPHGLLHPHKRARDTIVWPMFSSCRQGTPASSCSRFW